MASSSIINKNASIISIHACETKVATQRVKTSSRAQANKSEITQEKERMAYNGPSINKAQNLTKDNSITKDSTK